MMKKIIYAVVFLLGMGAMSSCEKFDDTDIWKEISTLQSRVAKLEDLCKVMNTNISSLQTIVNALQNNDYITNVAPVVKDGKTIGYTITFAKSGPITILNGENGKDGVNGQDGQNGKDGVDGKNGKDGKDGATPVISAVLGEDGLYYWTVNGEYLLDANGNKIAASGKDGVDGKDGEDGITPQLKIENGGWYVSVDNGTTWKYLGSATTTSSSPIVSVDDSNDKFVIFTLTNGTSIKVPKTPSDDYVEFEDLAFKYYCLAYFDTDKDSRISKEEAAAVTEISDVSAVSLKGIEYFINLQILDCWEMYFLDISKNTALTYLNCGSTVLPSLDISNNPALTYLKCCDNYHLISLDLSNNPALTYLDCHYTNLTSLDVSNCPELTYLNCEGINLTSLDVSNCPELTSLNCYGCDNLTEIWLKSGQKIDYFYYDESIVTIKYK